MTPGCSEKDDESVFSPEQKQRLSDLVCDELLLELTELVEDCLLLTGFHAGALPARDWVDPPPLFVPVPMLVDR